MSHQCHKCGKGITLNTANPIGRSERCPYCMADLRVCKMCQFFDSRSYNECREPVAERIVDKEKANYCDYFKLGTSGNDAEKQRQDALARAQALFKK